MRLRHAAAAAVLAAVALVGVAHGGGTATSPGVLRAKVADALEDEQRAWRLLARNAPRWETARGRLARSLTTLREVRGALGDGLARVQVDQAIAADIRALADISHRNRDEALNDIYKGTFHKSWAHGFLQPKVAARPQCADGRDNDGDRLVDARYDSGCTTAKDGSESSALTCTLRRGIAGASTVVRGSCSGPFARLEIAAPAGVTYDTRQAPTAGHAVGCYHPSARRLVCLLRDGAANRRRVVNVRLRYREGLAPTLRVLVSDFAGRRRAFTAADPAPPAFSLGPDPVQAVGTFTNGRGGCPFATSFRDTFLFFAPGDGTLTITQPRTGDRVSGPIRPDGSFTLRSAGEAYDGRITGATATATYGYTSGGCTQTYDASFELALPPADDY